MAANVGGVGFANLVSIHRVYQLFARGKTIYMVHTYMDSANCTDVFKIDASLCYNTLSSSANSNAMVGAVHGSVTLLPLSESLRCNNWLCYGCHLFGTPCARGFRSHAWALQENLVTRNACVADLHASSLYMPRALMHACEGPVLASTKTQQSNPHSAQACQSGKAWLARQKERHRLDIAAQPGRHTIHSGTGLT
eukprot:1161558-Pelagomonas_calceolata.AAC.11